MIDIVSFTSNSDAKYLQEWNLWETNLSFAIYCEEDESLRVTSLVETNPFADGVASHLRIVFGDPPR